MTMTDAERAAMLLPCPFCGGKPNGPTRSSAGDERNGYNFTIEIRCGSCRASLVAHSRQNSGGWCDDTGQAEAEARANWNRRAARAHYTSQARPPEPAQRCVFRSVCPSPAYCAGGQRCTAKDAAPASAPAPAAEVGETRVYRREAVRIVLAERHALRARVAELERNLLQEEREHNATMAERDALAAQVGQLTKAYAYTQDRLESLGYTGWAHDYDGEIAALAQSTPDAAGSGEG